MIEELKGWLGTKIHGISLNVDIVNGCPLRCPSCAVGSMGPRKGKMMKIDTFRRILDHAGKVRNVQLYAYSDPCVHPELHLFVQECTDRGITSQISTVLHITKCDFKKVIEARPSEFRISFAGWIYADYYQYPAKPEVFDWNFKRVCALPRHKETIWTMAFHRYKENSYEEHCARIMAINRNLKFVAIPAIFMPCEKVVEKNYSAQDRTLISHLPETPEETITKLKFHDDYCLLWKQIYMDANADVYLCQLIYEERFKLGNFFDTSVKEWLNLIKTDPFCQKCMKAGGHAYQYCFSSFTEHDDPVGHANKKRGLR